MARRHRAGSTQPKGGTADNDRLGQGNSLVAANAPNINDLAACIEDARQAALDGDRGPEDPTDFHQLRGRLEAARGKFPPLYLQEFVQPFITKLDQLGPAGFANILIQDPTRVQTAGLMLDMAHAILQRGEGFQRRATDAFQEVVGDLYDGFLSAEDRQGIEPPDQATTAPLVKWGNPDSGPYTWPVDATSSFGARAAVVNLPPANTRKGLLAWAALGHETGGHDILHADRGLSEQLAAAVQASLANMSNRLADYWSSRIDETASDVMGILNMGPAAAIGLIGYFRGLNAAFTGEPALRNEGPSGDPHPADIVRGYLAAETVALLPFGQSNSWSTIIASETDGDAQDIVLAGRRVSQADARESARRVAEAIATTKAGSLENHSLIDIQTWRDSDEEKVQAVRTILRTVGDLPEEEEPSSRIYAAHVVAAAVMEAMANGSNIPVIFDRMVNILSKMHARNPVWGPLLVRHRGNIHRDRAYIRPRSAPTFQDMLVRGLRGGPEDRKGEEPA